MNIYDLVKQAQQEIEDDIKEKAQAEIKELQLEVHAAEKVVREKKKALAKKIKEIEEELKDCGCSVE